MKILLILGIALILGGCSPYCYRSYPYALSRTDIEPHVEKAFDEKVVEKGELGSEWWRFFKDPQLNGLIELSLSNHPSIQLADARIRLACAQSQIARSALYPHIYGVADVKREKVSKFGEGFVPTIPTVVTQTTFKLASTLYELDIWGKNRSIYFAALDEVQALRADMDEAELLLSTALTAVYFDLQNKRARIELNRERLKAREELYALHRQQYNLGIIPEFRLFEVDTDVQLIRDLILVLEEEAEIDQNAIVALTGQAAKVIGEPTATFQTPLPLPASLPIDLLKRRPDVRAQIWRIQAACYGVNVAKAQFFPRIDLLGWLGFQSILIEKLFRSATLIALADGASSLPLFTAGKLCGELGVAREEVEIAVLGYNQTVLDAVQQVSDALAELSFADHRKEAIQKANQDARELFDLTDQKFHQGIINRLTLLNALENLYVQKDLELEIELARFEAAVDLIRAIGGGYDC